MFDCRYGLVEPIRSVDRLYVSVSGSSHQSGGKLAIYGKGTTIGSTFCSAARDR